MAFVLLVFLEVILGIDNVIFISLITKTIDVSKRKYIQFLGITIAVFLRIILLCFINEIFFLKQAHINFRNLSISYSQILFFFGGLFLLYQSFKEIYWFNKKKHYEESSVTSSLKVLAKIIFLDLVFSIDSLMTALAVTHNVKTIAAAIIISSCTMFLSVEKIFFVIEKFPRVKLLAIYFFSLYRVFINVRSFSY
jgi:predicted tellurium resistance membrane protein TerC